MVLLPTPGVPGTPRETDSENNASSVAREALASHAGLVTCGQDTTHLWRSRLIPGVGPAVGRPLSRAWEDGRCEKGE